MNAIKKITIIGFVFVLVNAANAYTIEQTGSTKENDFVLNQSKVELKLKPGQTAQIPLGFINRSKTERSFEIMQEDITGSANGSDAVMLLGEKAGELSAKSYIIPEVTEFTLKPGEKITLMVKVSLPETMEPGGRYAALIFANKSSNNAETSRTVSRLASLFFIEVVGNSTKDGLLQSFISNKKFIFDDATTTFVIAFQNNGNVHLDPYGQVSVNSILGQTVEQIEIKPFYSLPKALRNRIVDWKPTYALGVYKIDLQLNRGYDDIIDNQGFYVYVFSWKLAVYILIALIVIALVFKLLRSNISISIKK